MTSNLTWSERFTRLKKLLQRLPFDKFHREKQRTVDHSDIENSTQIRVRQSSHRPRFSEKMSRMNRMEFEDYTVTSVS